ncbi:DUF4955 domain-containing protein [Flammeovirga kamogawensis]|uniref:DUF4955 domain-containing protein n=1 Tax=Flammeovirga kamogawensis TaxID=373891 RepID=A0ABX8H5A1_9BACT|nr:DUF4955 domain-containing protein [Flammeovirga kamogawensis]MBB6461864.1 hypothetical protein [Flammeovirga kamogawensis]QWG10522.1 DUF4955 domain-containing protein [Flammeovirga kamogawensis]TRX63631.1 DUF4955 domain-containing protein [Flammeovirga kamogawensis]
MNKKLLIALLATLSVSISSVFAQESEVWKEYKACQETGETPKLPNFSFVGYEYSEVGIPVADYKIFDVTDFGAKPNDKKSDKKAIQKAIAAAEQNGEGIIFFPKGKYYINTKKDKTDLITVRSSNIVFRGEGKGTDGSILFFDLDLKAADPSKLWTAPFAIKTVPKGADKFLANVSRNAKRETFSVEVDNTNKIKVGDWVLLSVKNNAPDLVNYELAPAKCDPSWKTILNKGVIVNEKHIVKAIEGKNVIFEEPIHYDVQSKHEWTLKSYAHLEHIGFEHLAFEGNWKDEFKHHKDAVHDGGWSILNLNGVTDSWVQDCRFKDVSRSVHITKSAAVTALNCVIEGNPGHNAISMTASMGVLIANCDDQAGVWHSYGVSGGSSSNNVIWRTRWTPNTSFESHASQPRNTLFDCVEGGFFAGRGGGARQNLPNHLRNLVIWNFKETDAAEQNFTFWAKDTWFWKVIPPIVVGFHGQEGASFDASTIDVLESVGTPVKTTSLFEAQLELRLGELPDWIKDLKKEGLFF